MVRSRGAEQVGGGSGYLIENFRVGTDDEPVTLRVASRRPTGEPYLIRSLRVSVLVLELHELEVLEAGLY